MLRKMAIIIFISFLFTLNIVFASSREIICLLDTSVSMNDNDFNKLAPDSINLVLNTASNEDKVGFVSYNDIVQCVEPLESDRSKILNSINNVTYEGYTNAGAGLEKAISLFSDEENKKRYVILITDGEIMLPNDVDTLNSISLYEKALQEAADKNIKIITVAIGGKQNAPDINVYGSSDKQKIYEANTANDLLQVTRQILYDDLGFQKISVGTGTIKNNILDMDLPINSNLLGNVKVLVTSDGLLNNVAINYNAKDGVLYKGKQYALLDLINPQNNKLTLNMDFNSSNHINVDLLIEMVANIKTNVELLSGKDIASVKIIPVSKEDETIYLLKDPYFENKNIRIDIQGNSILGKVENGEICFTMPITEEQSDNIEANVHYEDLGINMKAPKVSFQMPKRNNYIIYIVGVMVGIVIIVVILLWKKQNKQPVVVKEVSPYEYAGKLKIYITKLKEDVDIAPMEYNLYRRFNKEEISLAEILHQCGIELNFEGADKVIFSPGAQKALIISNKSNCTILKNRELLLKNYNALIYFNERIFITFEDEFSEAILEYKSVKPSERQ